MPTPKAIGGEFFSPRSVVALLVEMLEPKQGIVFDPACGSGGMFVQPARFTYGNGKQLSFYIDLPPLPIQCRIAAILGRLDDKIEVNRRINRTLEQMAQALYKHWFVDFGRFRNAPMVESELGLIPEGWEVSTIGAEGEVISGGTPSTKVSEYWDNANGHDGTPRSSDL